MFPILSTANDSVPLCHVTNNGEPKNKFSVDAIPKTHSLPNSLLGDVVLDSFNIVYGDEDSILDQTYEKQIFLAFYSEDLKF